MRTRHIFAIALAGLVYLASCAQSSSPPKLAIVLIVDQMRADHLTRFADLYTGGFARVMREGRVFSQSYHDHAITFTGTGHATIATGCYPSNHGVIGNGWEDRQERARMYCCGDSTSRIFGHPEMSGRSPATLARPAMSDLLKKAAPEAKLRMLPPASRKWEKAT